MFSFREDNINCHRFHINVALIFHIYLEKSDILRIFAHRYK